MLHIKAFCETYGFDPAAASHFAAQYQILKSYADAYGVFCRQLEACRGDRGFDHGPVFENLHGLQEATGIETVMYDERLTTVWAHKTLSENNVRGKKRKAVVDAVSAVVILEGFMATRK